MEFFRNKSKMTRLLILLEIVLRRPNDQISIARYIDITPQAVSEYLRIMRDDGLVDHVERVPRATVAGVEFLQSSLLHLKEFVDTNISKLEIIRSTDSIASEDIKAGQRVGLFMSDGLLYAGKLDNCNSFGIADVDARKGEIVAVSELSGVLDLTQPSLILLTIVPARQGGRGQRLQEKEWKARKEMIEENLGTDSSFRTAVLDMEAVALMKRSLASYEMEMPGNDTLMSTLERGVSIFCIGTPFSISRLKEVISNWSLMPKVIELDPIKILT